MHDLWPEGFLVYQSFILRHLYYISCTHHYTFLEKQVLGYTTVALPQLTHSRNFPFPLLFPHLDNSFGYQN